MARLAGAGREAMTAPRRVNRVETPDPEERPVFASRVWHGAVKVIT
jgi:hypothetical protein